MEPLATTLTIIADGTLTILVCKNINIRAMYLSSQYKYCFLRLFGLEEGHLECQGHSHVTVVTLTLYLMTMILCL